MKMRVVYLAGDRYQAEYHAIFGSYFASRAEFSRSEVARRLTARDARPLISEDGVQRARSNRCQALVGIARKKSTGPRSPKKKKLNPLFNYWHFGKSWHRET